MQLGADTQGPANRVTGYGPGLLRLRDRTYESSVIVTPDAVLDWPVVAVEQLAAADFEPALARGVEVILLATGARQRWPAPGLLAALAARRVGLEVMDVGAAARTYNLLAGDGRAVALAAILAPGY